jgi:hypothetical protein
MKVQTHRALYAIAFMFAFSVVFAIATLTGFTIPSALIVGELAGLALIVAPIVAVIVMALVPATIIKEERLTIRAPREAVYAAIADPRSAPRHNHGDRGGGRARCGRHALAGDDGGRQGLRLRGGGGRAPGRDS